MSEIIFHGVPIKWHSRKVRVPQHGPDYAPFLRKLLRLAETAFGPMAYLTGRLRDAYVWRIAKDYRRMAEAYFREVGKG